MRERLLQLTLLATLAMLGTAAAPVSASHVQCGDTIDQDTTLDADMLCTGDGAIEIEGTGVTLDLNGHTIDGGGTGGFGVRSHSARQLEIKNGTIQGFTSGTDTESMDGQRLSGLVLRDNRQGAHLYNNEGPTEVVNTVAAGNTIGLNLDGGVRVAHSRVTDNANIGIALDFTGATIEDNVIARNKVGVDVEEAYADIVRNRIVANTGTGIRYGYWQNGTVTDNLIERNGVGVDFNRSEIAVRRNAVQLNQGAGIRGGHASAVIERNTVRRNGGTGIVSGCTPVLSNTVHTNGANGIRSDCREYLDPPIEDNDVRRNAGDGIVVRDNSGLVEVTGNRAFANGDDGIDIDGLAISLADDTVWSPDATLVAGTVSPAEDGPPPQDIYLFDGGGDGARRLVAGSGPSWSPSGDEIAYHGSDGVHVIGVDGAGDRFLTEGASPQWSPTGDTILFLRGNAIYAIAAAGGTPVELAARGSDPEWSPDGNTVVYQRDNEIHVVHVDGTGDSFVTEGGYPTWSPDGERIAFTDGTELVTIRPDGSDLRYLTIDDPQDWAPDWSPDGSQIAFLRAPADGVGAFVIDAAGGSPARIAAGSDRPRWAPDSTRLLVGRSILRPDGTLIAELGVNLNPFVTVTGNRADRNADLGIEAVEQVKDGGGNRARGNGDPRQCVGVACG